MIAKLIDVKAINKYSIRLKFSDNTEGVVDLSYLLGKPVFHNWTEGDFFDRVHINQETNSIAWDENIELCPFSLYLKLKGLTYEQWKSNK